MAIVVAVPLAIAADPFAGPSGAVQFCNTGQIVGVGGTATKANPYPSRINVSGLTGTVTDVNVLLFDFSHLGATFGDPAYSSDIDVLVVGPTGANAVPFSDVGDDNVDAPPQIPASSSLDFILDNQAANALPADTPLASGTFRPTDDDFDVDEQVLVDTFPDAPTPSGGSALTVFNGTDPNGTWSLYMVDDFSGATTAQFAGGWCVDILTTTGPSTTTSSTTSSTTTSTTSSTTTSTTPSTSTTTSTTPPSSTTSTPSSSTSTIQATTTTTQAPGTCDGQAATITGTSGNDRLFGTAGPDVIVARAGNDQIFGLGGSDVICGEAGTDEIHGGEGNDQLFGGNDNDRLVGGNGNDTLNGGAANDQCFGDAHTTGDSATACETVGGVP